MPDERPMSNAALRVLLDAIEEIMLGNCQHVEDIGAGQAGDTQTDVHKNSQDDHLFSSSRVSRPKYSRLRSCC